MMTIGCDFHPSRQQVSWLDTETGETGEQKLVLQRDRSLPATLLYSRVVYFDLISTVSDAWLTSRQRVPPFHRSSLCDDLIRSG
jgi:hypothetical protein